MKFYAIPPIKHLDLTHSGDSYFVLAHLLLQDKTYRQFFTDITTGIINAKPYHYITLDNGSAEHSLVTEETLLNLTEEFVPDEVVAPDVLFDKDQTLRNLDSFVAEMDKRGLLHYTSIFGCPQGSNKQEWLECYTEMANHPHVSVIGLSKIAVPKCWNNVTGDVMIAQSRNECVQELFDRGLLTKPLHLLGMGEHNEFDYYAKHNIPNIRSSDSCYSILAALNGISFEAGNTVRIPTTNAYFDVTMSAEQQTLAKQNIAYLINKYQTV
jgi:hypothetical protein